MQLSVYNLQGQQTGTIEVDDLVFGIEPNQAVLHQVTVAQQANRRAGTHDTKTRGEVSGSTRKIRPQKYTGRARLGSIRAPHLRHGGVVFGPHPRSYKQQIPKVVRRLAIRSALSAKVASGDLKVVESLSLDGPKTKAIAAALACLGVDRSALLVTETADRTLLLSARNLPGVAVVPADYISALEILSRRSLVMTVSAVRRAEALWGGVRAKHRVAKAEVA